MTWQAWSPHFADGVTWIDLIRRRREIRQGHWRRHRHFRLHCLGWEVLKLPSLDLAMEFYFWTTICTLFLISQSKVMLVTGNEVAVMLTQSKIMDSALWVEVERFGEWNGYVMILVVRGNKKERARRNNPKN